MMVAECQDIPAPVGNYTVHDVPGWDWSLARLAGVDFTDPDWLMNQVMWSGTTLVKRA